MIFQFHKVERSIHLSLAIERSGNVAFQMFAPVVIAVTLVLVLPLHVTVITQ